MRKLAENEHSSPSKPQSYELLYQELFHRSALMVLDVMITGLIAISPGYSVVDATRHVADGIVVDPYIGRDGEAEARAHISAGKPARLYAHALNGEAPGFGTPGLRGCAPRATRRIALFLPLPDADFQEGAGFATKWAESATKFASAFNRTMFRRKRSEIVRICPDARLE